MEVTDKNTIIYNLYKKIECLEQALTISKQRMNAQLNEIEVKSGLLTYSIVSIFYIKELRSRNLLITSSTTKETV